MILGAILLVLGVACAGYGYLQNNSIEAQLSSLLSTGTTNPGTIYIVIGAVVAVVGALVCGWSLYKRHGKGSTNAEHQSNSVPPEYQEDVSSHENNVERVKGTGTEPHVDPADSEQEKENDWTVEQPLPVDEESDALNQQSEEPKEKKGIKITRKMCVLGGVALVAVIGIAVLARFGYAYWTDPQRDVDRKAAGEYATAVDYYESGEYDLALEKTEAIDTTWTRYQKAEKLRVDIIKARLDEIRSSYEGDQKYTEVISYVKRKVPNLDIDAEIRERYEQAVEEYKASVLKKADELEDAEDYSGAVREVETALQLIGSDAKLEERVHQLGKTEILKAVETYEASKEYDTAIQFIRDRIGDYETDSEVVLAYNRCKDAFRNSIIQEAEAAYENSGYESALSIVNNALTVLPGDQQLMSEKDIYTACAPVDLTTLTPYFEGYISVLTGEVTDTLGNTYHSGLQGYRYKSDAAKLDCYNIWDIGGEYNTLTATGIVLEDDKGTGGTALFRIYGDGVLLYEKADIDSKTKPYKVEVDITGVTDLKIEMYGNGISNYFTSRLSSVLVDVMLQRKK